MEKVVPWARLCAVIAPHYPKGERGRPPIGLERMLRIYFLQQWYALADEALEDALYDSQALRTFAGIDLSVEAVPDATTLLGFRHLLEAHQLTQAIFTEVGALLRERKLLMKEGTIVDATIIAAPSSTKNLAKGRDPEMHQTKKGNQWYFGMKAHIGVDAQSGLVHHVTGTAANVADIAQTHELLHGEEKAGFADAGYLGVEKRAEILRQCPDVAWHVAAKRGKIKALAEGAIKELTQQLEKLKAQVRARVEHPRCRRPPALPFGQRLRPSAISLRSVHILKNLFRHRKTRYRGLAKNTAQLHSLFALANRGHRPPLAADHRRCLSGPRERRKRTAKTSTQRISSLPRTTPTSNSSAGTQNCRKKSSRTTGVCAHPSLISGSLWL